MQQHDARPAGGFKSRFQHMHIEAVAVLEHARSDRCRWLAMTEMWVDHCRPMKNQETPAAIVAFLVSFIILNLAFAADSGAPPSEQRAVTDSYQTVTVTDPYRWLENTADPKVHEWSAAQDARARKSSRCAAAARADFQAIVQPNLGDFQFLCRPARRRGLRVRVLHAAAEAAADDRDAHQCRRPRSRAGRGGSERHQRQRHDRHRLVRAFTRRQDACGLDVGKRQRGRHAAFV